MSSPTQASIKKIKGPDSCSGNRQRVVYFKRDGDCMYCPPKHILLSCVFFKKLIHNIDYVSQHDFFQSCSDLDSNKTKNGKPTKFLDHCKLCGCQFTVFYIQSPV